MQIRTKLFHPLLTIWVVCVSAVVLLTLFVGIANFNYRWGAGGLAPVVVPLVATAEAAILATVLNFGKGLPIGKRLRRLIEVEMIVGGLLLVVLIGVLFAGYGDTFLGEERDSSLEGSMLVVLDTVQTAMDAMMADQKISKVVATDASQNDFTVFPKYTRADGRPGSTLDGYLKRSKSVFYLCWNESGKITRLDRSPQPDCPEEFVGLSQTSRPFEWLPALYGVLGVTGMVAMTAPVMTLRNRRRARDDI